MRCYPSNDPASRSQCIACAECAHNTLVSSATGLPPFQFQYCNQAPLFPEQECATQRSTQDLIFRTEPKKLSPRIIGPSKVIRRINPTGSTTSLFHAAHPTFPVSLLKPATSSLLAPPPPPKPPPRLLDGRPVIYSESDCGLSGGRAGFAVFR